MDASDFSLSKDLYSSLFSERESGTATPEELLATGELPWALLDFGDGDTSSLLVIEETSSFSGDFAGDPLY